MRCPCRGSTGFAASVSAVRASMDAMSDTSRAEHVPAPAIRTAVVTGASSGIGRATAALLASRGWRVLAVARRAERLEALAAETGCLAHAADLTSDEDVAALAAAVRELGGAHALVNVAGGAIGAESVEAGSIDDWRRMFEMNVIATKRVVTALLPELRRAAAAEAEDGAEFAHADVLTVTSTAATTPYEGGAGYNAAKAAERMLVRVLRLELAGEPIRVLEIAPGMVMTEEFSTVRYRGDEQAAATVYAGVDHPLTAEDVAASIVGALELPGHVNIDELVVRPVAQAAQHKVVRAPLAVKDAPTTDAASQGAGR